MPAFPLRQEDVGYMLDDVSDMRSIDSLLLGETSLWHGLESTCHTLGAYVSRRRLVCLGK